MCLPFPLVTGKFVRVAGLSWSAIPQKKNSEDSGDVINVPTRVACVVQEHAKGTKLGASVKK